MAQTRFSYDVANRNEAILRKANGLTLLRHRLDREMSRLAAFRTPAATAVALLHRIQTESIRLGIKLTGFSPGNVARGAALKREAIEVKVRGQYGDILRFVSALSGGNALLEVDGVDLARNTTVDRGITVDATVHSTLFEGIASLDASPAPPQQ